MESDSDSDIDENPQAFAIPPALGFIVSLMASMAVCLALLHWEKSDTTTTTAVGGAQTGAIQVSLFFFDLRGTSEPSRCKTRNTIGKPQ